METEWIPLAAEQPGFAQHGVAQTGERVVISFTAYATKDQGAPPTGASAAWMQENLLPVMTSVEQHEGTGHLGCTATVDPHPQHAIDRLSCHVAHGMEKPI